SIVVYTSVLTEKLLQDTKGRAIIPPQPLREIRLRKAVAVLQKLETVLRASHIARQGDPQQECRPVPAYPRPDADRQRRVRLCDRAHRYTAPDGCGTLPP